MTVVFARGCPQLSAEDSMTSNTLLALVVSARRRLELKAHIGDRKASCPQVAAARRRGTACRCAEALGIAVAAVFVHWVFIDHALFRPQPTIRSGVESVATTSDSAGEVAHWICAMDHGTWQPLGRFSLIAELKAHGARHDDFILTNIALHAVAAGLLFLVILRAAGSRLLAACAAGTFAAHPATITTTGWLAGRAELLGAVFGLSAVLWYLDFRRRGRKRSIAASVLSSMAAALASPALIALPVLLPLVHAATSRKRAAAASSVRRTRFAWRRPDWRFWSFVAATLVAGVGVICEFSQASTTHTAIETLRRRGALLPSSIATQIGRTIVPHWIAWELPETSRWTWWIAVVTAAVLVAACLGSIVFIRRFPMICAGWLWFVAAVIPSAGIAVLGGKDGLHACAYVPLIGSTTAAVFLVWMLVNSRSLRVVGIPLVAVANIAILARMSLAQGPSSIERWADLASDTGVATMREASGRSYAEHLTCTETNWLDAMASIESGLDGTKDAVSVQRRTGTALDSLGHTAAAVLHYRRSIELDPNCFSAEYNLGRIELENKRWSEAEQHFWRAVEIAPTQGRPYVALARIYEERGATFEAIEYLKRAMELEPALADFDPGVAAIYPSENVTGVIARLQRSLTRSQEGSEAGLELAKILQGSRNLHAAGSAPAYSAGHQAPGAVGNRL
jgi:protein O-mannosyl-transferase